MTKKIIIDKTKCMGCGSCAALAPKSFKMGDNGKAQVINPVGDDDAVVKSAIDGCPVSAMKWEEK